MVIRAKKWCTCLRFLGNSSFYNKLRKGGIISPKIQELVMQGVDCLFIRFDELKTKRFRFGSFVYTFVFLY